MRWLYRVTDSIDMNLNKLWEIVEGRGAAGVLHSMGSQSEHDLVTEQHQQQLVSSEKTYIHLFYT